MLVKFIQSLFALIVFVFYFGIVNGSAGLIKPIPSALCNSNDTLGCKIIKPCHKINTPIVGDVNPINIMEKYEYAIYQLDSKINSTSENTYTVLFFKELENTGYQLFTFNQNDMDGNGSSYGIIMDAIKLNDNLMSNINFGDDGYVYGTMELTFDARSGGGNTYYSCANVRLQKRPFNTTLGKTIEIESTLTLTSNNSNHWGSLETDGIPTHLFIPNLVSREESSDISTFHYNSTISTSDSISYHYSDNNNNNNSALNNNKVYDSLITILFLVLILF